MSLNSSNTSSKVHTWSYVSFLAAWIVTGFFIAQMTIVFVWRALIEITQNEQILEGNALLQLIISASAYVLALVIIVGLPKVFDLDKERDLKKQFGIVKKIKLRDTGYALLGYGGYFFLTLAFVGIVQILWQNFPYDQTQQVGFDSISTPVQYILAFLALVVVAPFVEELLFRGYFYGMLRKHIGFIASTLLTSIVFALVHFQWNVGVDVFALSLVLCYLREHTGALWASIGLHMIKNSIAFCLLFLQPQLLQLFM